MFFLLNDTITVNENSPPQIHLNLLTSVKKNILDATLMNVYNNCQQF